MEFCQKCGGMILVTDGRAACVSCGKKLDKKPKIEASEKMEKAVEIQVVKEEADSIYPEVDMLCPKCKNKKAFFWTMQTRASDESETKFYKCTKCKHTWRKYR
jgi:DNA-directed RNA polymerase subunit M